jgi:hypothetical protein
MVSRHTHTKMHRRAHRRACEHRALNKFCVLRVFCVMWEVTPPNLSPNARQVAPGCLKEVLVKLRRQHGIGQTTCGFGHVCTVETTK